LSESKPRPVLFFSNLLTTYLEVLFSATSVFIDDRPLGCRIHCGGVAVSCKSSRVIPFLPVDIAQARFRRVSFRWTSSSRTNIEVQVRTSISSHQVWSSQRVCRDSPTFSLRRSLLRKFKVFPGLPRPAILHAPFSSLGKKPTSEGIRTVSLACSPDLK